MIIPPNNCLVVHFLKHISFVAPIALLSYILTRAGYLAVHIGFLTLSHTLSQLSPDDIWNNFHFDT